MAERKSKKFRPEGKWFAVVGVGLTVTLFLLGISMFVYQKRSSTPSGVNVSKVADQRRLNRVQQTPTGQNQSSEEYQQQVRQHAEEQASEAEQGGKSYIAPPINAPQGHADDGFDEFLTHKQDESRLKKVAQQPESPRTKNRTRGQEQEDGVYDHLQRRAQQGRYASMMDALSDTEQRREVRQMMAKQLGQVQEQREQRFGMPSTEVYDNTGAIRNNTRQHRNDSTDRREESAGRQSQEPVQQQPVGGEQVEASREYDGVQPGDVLYAINNQAINSDMGGHSIVVQIVSGELKGARALGEFEKREDHLKLTFRKIITEDGVSYDTLAYAVDPETASVAVRSDVNHHYLNRWGGLIAASFFEGFGEAVAQSGIAQSQTDGVIVQSHPDYSVEDQAWIAGGKVGEQLSEQAAKNFDRPSTVTLNPGTPLGLLIVEPMMTQ